MAWCLTAPSHYLNQCWLIINGTVWHSPKTNFMRSSRYQVVKWAWKHTWNITSTSLRGQWVNHSSADKDGVWSTFDVSWFVGSRHGLNLVLNVEQYEHVSGISLDAGIKVRLHPWQPGSRGQHGAHLGPVVPRWAPCRSHEPCSLGLFTPACHVSWYMRNARSIRESCCLMQ